LPEYVHVTGLRLHGINIVAGHPCYNKVADTPRKEEAGHDRKEQDMSTTTAGGVAPRDPGTAAQWAKLAEHAKRAAAMSAAEAASFARAGNDEAAEEAAEQAQAWADNATFMAERSAFLAAAEALAD